MQYKFIGNFSVKRAFLKKANFFAPFWLKMIKSYYLCMYYLSTTYLLLIHYLSITYPLPINYLLRHLMNTTQLYIRQKISWIILINPLKIIIFRPISKKLTEMVMGRSTLMNFWLFLCSPMLIEIWVTLSRLTRWKPCLSNFLVTGMRCLINMWTKRWWKSTKTVMAKQTFMNFAAFLNLAKACLD